MHDDAPGPCCGLHMPALANRRGAAEITPGLFKQFDIPFRCRKINRLRSYSPATGECRSGRRTNSIRVPRSSEIQLPSTGHSPSPPSIHRASTRHPPAIHRPSNSVLQDRSSTALDVLWAVKHIFWAAAQSSGARRKLGKSPSSCRQAGGGERVATHAGNDGGGAATACPRILERVWPRLARPLRHRSPAATWGHKTAPRGLRRPAGGQTCLP